MKILKRIGFALLGVVALLALLCSVAAVSVTNEALMEEGFLQFSDTARFSVPSTRYADYAKSLAAYLDDKEDTIAVRDADGTLQTPFSEKENAHMEDVRFIVRFLKGMRWVGGGLVLAVIAALYLFGGKRRSAWMKQVFCGFSDASMLLLLAAAGLGIWGAVDFDSLFYFFHTVAFPNDLWLLNPATDLLIALMPQRFFVWYAGEMGKSFLPILGIMVCIPVAWFKVGKKEA